MNRSAALLIGAFLLSFPASPRTRVPASFSPHSPSPRPPVPPSSPGVLVWGGDAEGGAPYVEADPAERRNIAADNPALAAELEKQVKEWYATKSK